MIAKLTRTLLIALIAMSALTSHTLLAQPVQDEARLQKLKAEYSPSMPEALPEPTVAGDPVAVYVQYGADPTKTLLVNWIAKVGENTKLLYRQRGQVSWSQTSGEVRPFAGTAEYEIRGTALVDLQADTYYEWQFQENGEIFIARTMPATQSRVIRFGQGGDMFNWYQLTKQMNQVIAAKDPDFVVFCGDIAQDNGEAKNYKKWILFLNLWQTTMRGPKDNRLIPIAPAIGNHEVGNGGSGRPKSDALFYYDIFPFPGKNGYGVQDFGDYLSLILLDSGHTNRFDGAQRVFLEDTLKARQDGRTLISAHHVPLYPVTRHPLNSENVHIRKSWEPLYDQYGLDLSLNGDEHTYKRTWPIRNGAVHPEGVIYAGDGGWGVIENRTPKQPGRFLLMDEYWYLAKSWQQNYGMIVELEGDQLRLKAFNRHGEMIDDFQFTLNEPIEGVPTGRSRLPEYELIGILGLAIVMTLLAVLGHFLRKRRLSTSA